MNHYIEEVDDRGDARSVLAAWKTKALQERSEHLEQYVARVVRRPLGKLLVLPPLRPSFIHTNIY